MNVILIKQVSVRTRQPDDASQQASVARVCDSLVIELKDVHHNCDNHASDQELAGDELVCTLAAPTAVTAEATEATHNEEGKRKGKKCTL